MLVIFSLKYLSLLFVFVAYVMYFKKHLNILIFASIILIFGLRMLLFTIPIDEFSGMVRIEDIETFEYSERITVSYQNKRYVFYAQKDQYKLGDMLEMEAEIITFEKPTRPFGFNEYEYYLGNHIHGKLNINRVEVIKSSFHVLSLREHLMSRIETLKSSSLIAALWFGKNDDLDKDILSSWNILFLFKVTGIHVYAFLLMIKKLFVENSFVYKVLHISMLICFWYLQAFHVTMFRYILLWLIYHVFKRFNIRLHAVTIVLIAFTMHLLIQPYLMFHVGFMLGYSIVFFIRILMQWMPYQHSLFSTYRLSMHISIWIGIFTQKLYVISILLMPMFIWFVAYVLFLGSFVVWFMPIFDGFLYQVYEQFIYMLNVFEDIQIALFIPSMNGIFQVMLISIIVWMLMSKTYALMVKKTLMLVLLIGVSFLTIRIDEVTHMYFLDVGQGDAFLMKSKSCVTVIDAFDGIKETLQGLGIHQVDYFFLTHNDLDHTKEKDEIMNTFHVKHAYTSRFQEIDGFESMPMNRVLTCGQVTIKALSPYQNYQNDNENSLVLLLSIQDTKMLFMGDAGIETEEELIKEYGEHLKADVLKIGHHGSNTSTSKRFINVVKPSYAVISVGRNNRYGMPHASVINTLNNFPVITYRTDLMGTIHFEFYRNDMWIHTFL